MTEAKSEDRYKDLANWYDEFAAPSADTSRGELMDLLGGGTGYCLDLGCGTGLYMEAMESIGWYVIGVDKSADQLKVAQSRSRRLILGDALRLPFADGSFRAVAAIWITTDVDDFGAAMAEVARVLAPGGRLVIYGAHPCFNGPFVETQEDSRLVHPGYRVAGRYYDSPWWGTEGVRSRVGMTHIPLAHLLNGVIQSGLRIEKLSEPRDEPVPFILAIVATKESGRTATV